MSSHVGKRNVDVVERFEDDLTEAAAKRIKLQVEEEVASYLAGEEFRMFIDTLKRRERERVVKEVEEEIRIEKESMLAGERRRLREEQEEKINADEILLRNKMIMEEKQRKEYEEKMKADAERLRAIQEKIEQERIEELERDAAAAKEKQEKEQILGRDKKLSFGLARKKLGGGL